MGCGTSSIQVAPQAQVSCDVPGRCSLKRVVHPGDFRQSESSLNEQVDRKGPDERTQECAKLPAQSSATSQTSLRTRLVGARGVGGPRYESPEVESRATEAKNQVRRGLTSTMPCLPRKGQGDDPYRESDKQQPELDTAHLLRLALNGQPCG